MAEELLEMLDADGDKLRNVASSLHLRCIDIAGYSEIFFVGFFVLRMYNKMQYTYTIYRIRI